MSETVRELTPLDEVTEVLRQAWLAVERAELPPFLREPAFQSAVAALWGVAQRDRAEKVLKAARLTPAGLSVAPH